MPSILLDYGENTASCALFLLTHAFFLTILFIIINNEVILTNRL
jgi:hypothetical protein